MKSTTSSSVKILWLLSLLVLFHPSHQKRDYYFQLDSCEVDSSTSKVCESNCTLTKKDDLLAVSGFMNILESGDSGGMIIELSGRALNGANYKPLMGLTSISKSGGWITMINNTIPDVCVLLKDNSRSNIIQIGIAELMKSGRLPSCPPQKGVYYIKDYYLSPEYFPPFLPEGEFKAKGKFFGVKGGERLECANFKVTGKIRHKKNQRGTKN